MEYRGPGADSRQRLPAPLSVLGRMFVNASGTPYCGRSWEYFLEGDPKHSLPNPVLPQANLIGLTQRYCVNTQADAMVRAAMSRWC